MTKASSYTLCRSSVLLLVLLFSAVREGAAEDIAPRVNPPRGAAQAVIAATPVLDSEEVAFLTLINNYRAQNGAGPLQVSVALQTSSQWMSNDMATHNSSTHTDSLGRDPQSRMAAFGYPYYPWGENIAGGFSSAQSVFDSWSTYCDPDASGNCTYAHRQNMLNPSFVVIGIGRTYSASSTYGWYWTTDFGGVLDQTLNPAGNPPTIGYFGASQYTVSPGQVSTLSWITSGATSITLDQGIGNVTNVTSAAVSTSSETTYTLTATNGAGSATAQVMLSIATGSCHMDLIQQNSALLSFPPDIACETIGKYFVSDITYRGSDGNCYETNVYGTKAVSCAANPPGLPNGQIPNTFDSKFNWLAANGQCWYTQGDTAPGGAPYGVSSQKICGFNSSGIPTSHVITILTPQGGSGPAATMSFSPGNLSMTAPGTQNLTLNLSSPAPAGGLTVTLNSSSAGVAAVPASVTVAPNAASVAVPATANGSGSAVITASAPSYGSASASVSVSVVSGVVITTPALANGQAGIPYSQPLVAAGGTPPYAWSLVSGALPSALALNGAAGLISGTPAGAVTNTPLSVQVKDSSVPAKTATANFTLTVTNVGGPVIVLPANVTMNPGDQSAFPVTLSSPAQTGGAFISLVSSNPSVVTVNTANVFIAEGQTASTRTKLTAAGAGTATITASAAGFAPASTLVQVGSAPSGTMSFQPASLTIGGGATQNVLLTLSAPAPAGLTVSLSSSNPGIAAVPATAIIAANTASATVAVSGLAGGSATITASAANYTPASAGVTVTAALAITMTPLVNGQAGVPYSQTLAASGGTAPYTWALISGALPGGLSLNKSTGQISGTPAAAGTNTPLTFQVADSSSPVKTATANFTLTIAAAAAAASIAPASGTPQTASANTPYAAPLAAIVKDAGGNPVSGVTVTFAAPLQGAGGSFAGGGNTAVTNGAGVAVSGTFTANSIGGSYVVTASAPGVAAPASFLLTNVTGPSIILPASVTLNPGDQSAFPITLSSSAPPGGVFISLANSNTSIVTANTDNVFIPEGQTASTRSKLSALAMGSATITASASGFSPASTKIQVGSGPAATLSFTPASVTIAAPGSQNLTLILSTPAPAGGLLVNLSSSNTSVASVPAVATIAANGSSATVTVTGLAAGSAIVTAGAAGVSNATAGVTVTSAQPAAILLPANTTVGLGGSAAFPVTLAAPAAAGGVTIALSSTDTSKVTVPATVFIAGGATTPATQPQINGINAGSAAISASAAGYTPATGQVQVTAGSSSFSPSSLTIQAGAAGNLTLILSAPAPAGGLSASLSSSNTGIASVPAAVIFSGGAVSAIVPVAGVAAGSATITANAPNFGLAMAGVTVSSPTSGIILPTSVTLLPGQSAAFPVSLATAAPSGGVFIALNSDSPAVTVAPANIFIPQGAMAAGRAPVVNGVGNGSANITATATGFTTASTQVQVGSVSAATMNFSPGSLTINSTTTQNLTLTLSAPPAGSLTVNLSSSNTGVAAVPATAAFAANATTTTVPVTGVAPGSATITAIATGLPNATASVTVTQSSLINLPANATVGLGQSVTLPVSLPTAAPANGVTVYLASSDTTTAAVTPGVYIPGGATTPVTQPQVSGINAGSALIIAAAAGYSPGSGQVQVTPGGGSSSFSPTTLAITAGSTPQNLTLNLSAPAQSALTVTLSSSNSGVAAVPATVLLSAGATAVTVPVTGITPGSVTITANTPNFGIATASVTVSSLQGVSVTWYGACWQGATLYGVTGNFQAMDFALSTPTPVTLQGSLFFAANCDPSQGIDNMNDFGSLTNSGHMVQGFSLHPDVIPTSAIYWIGPRTADGRCAPGSPCSGCVNYNVSTPSCSALP